MDELLRQVHTILRGMWDRRWLGVGAAWAIGIIVAAVVYRIPDQYEATARVHMDTQTILRPLMSGLAVQQDTAVQAAMLGRTLISRPNIENLLKGAGGDSERTKGADQDRIVDSLIARIKLISAGRDNLFSVSFRDTDPGYAVRIVEGLVTMFLAASQGDKRKDADAAQRFIGEQISNYEKKLEEAENRVKEFKIKHMGLLGTDGKDSFARIAEAAKIADRVRIELRAAMQSRDALRRELAGEEPIFLIDTSVEVASPSTVNLTSEVDGRLESAKKQLDELLRKYTDFHPDVKNTKELVEQLAAQKQRELDQRQLDLEAKKRAAPPSTNKPSPLSANPVIARIKISLAEAEGNIASLQSMAAEHESQHRQLRAMAQQFPQIEAEYAQLNRDYDVQKKNYESLVSRREQAALSGEMGAVGGLTSFRVVDPPRVTPTPVWPNRKQLLPLALIAALAVGLGVCFAASQIAPTFHDARDLREVIERPVLGTVSILVTESLARANKRSNFAFGAAICGLVCVYGAVFLMFSVSGRIA
ncbi:MAG: XrtA system polysaccharide chain length determinant [Burkholderiales bacterium]